MSIKRTIWIRAVLPCEACDYDLRGLRSDGRCPECGTTIADTLRATHKRIPQITTILERAYLHELAEPAGCTVDGALFILAVIGFAHRKASREEPSFVEQPRHLTAAEIVAALCEYALVYFNDKAEAVDLLHEWKLRTGEDVGRAVAVLIEAGFLFIAQNDDVRQFAGLFSLEKLLDK